MNCIIIGIAGGTGSGKSTFTRRLKEEFKENVAVIYHDNYYRRQDEIPFEDRIEIVRSCKYVDAAVPQYDMDKLKACRELGATMLFVGDDWYGTKKWERYEEDAVKEGIKIIYFPYTKGVSSTKITEALKAVRGWTAD